MIDPSASDLSFLAKTVPVGDNVGIGTASAQFIPRDTHRTSIVISSPVTNDLWISWQNNAAAGTGLRLAAGMAPLRLLLVDDGALVYGPIYAASPAGAQTISWYGSAAPCHCND